MMTQLETTETVFRGPKSATTAPREITLTNEFKEDKGHRWLEKRRLNERRCEE